MYVGSILLYFGFCVGLVDFAVNFLLSVPVQVIAWRTVSEMTCNVSSGTLNLTYSLTDQKIVGVTPGRVTIMWVGDCQQHITSVPPRSTQRPIPPE